MDDVLFEAEADEVTDSRVKTHTDRRRVTDDEILGALGRNEDGDAAVYIRLFKDELVYDHAAGLWFQFNGQFWEEDRIDEATAKVSEVVRLYADMAQKMSTRKIEAKRNGNDQVAQEYEAAENALLKRITKLQVITRKIHVLEIANNGIASLGITGEEWDQNADLLPVKNGVIDLRTGEYRDGHPSDFIKSVTGTVWKGLNAPAPSWEKALDEIFAGDAETVSFLQRLLGYSVSGKVTEHIMPVLWGIGRNGKGTLLETLQYVLGDLAGPTESELLLKQKIPRGSGAPASDIVHLRGKRIVWASETDEGRMMNSGRVKWITGGDTLTGRAPYGKRPVSFRPTHTLFLLTNHKPRVSPDDYALWQRIILVPFTLSFVKEPTEPHERQVDLDLPRKLQEEAPGILAWLVRGLMEYRERGLDPPESVRAATQEYRVEEDIMGDFLEDRCILKPNTQVASGILYAAYRDWCEENGYHAKGQKKFSQSMMRRFDSVRSNGTYFIGVDVAE